MPEMTPERVEALAQSARDRDPNPEPLDAERPEAVFTVTHKSGNRADFREVDEYEVTPAGALTISGGSESGGRWFSCFAPGEWVYCCYMPEGGAK